MYRKVEKTETDILRRSWQWEREFPAFYLDASNIWTETETEALSFFAKCSALFAVSNGSGIYGLVYFEPVTDTVENVHLALRRSRVDEGLLITDLIAVRNKRLSAGIRQIMTWVLAKNRALLALCAMVGFMPSGLTMKCGTSHGKILEWKQLLIEV